jgi:hypothetical protein
MLCIGIMKNIFPPYTLIDLFIYLNPNFAFSSFTFSCVQRKSNRQTRRHHRAEREACRTLREEATTIIAHWEEIIAHREH